MPIAFTCPHCQTSMNVEERFAGTKGPCRNCGEVITIPGTAAPAFTPAPPQKSSAITVLLVLAVLGIVGFFVVGILVALLLPAVQSAREAARRVQCVNHQKQIALGLLNYESANGHFPPAYIADEDGKPMHSWRVLILPYIEEQALYDRYDFDEPWDSPANLAVTQQMPQVYRCPSVPTAGTETSYMVVNDPGSVFPGSKEVAIGEIKDGMSQTVTVLETTGSGVHWSEPKDLSIGELGTLSSAHPGGLNVAFSDGSVQFIPTVTPNMVTIDDGS